jgi:GNAT superfamily N-acetyltransferase
MRKAVPSDVPELVSMMEKFYAESGFTLNQHRAAQAFATLLADDHLGSVFFIQDGTEDVGYLVVTFCYSMEYGGPSAFVDDLFVLKPFRGKGLGTAALSDLRAFCAERGVRAIHVETGRDNAAGQAMYRRTGFLHTDRQLLTLKLANPAHEE